MKNRGLRLMLPLLSAYAFLISCSNQSEQMESSIGQADGKVWVLRGATMIDGTGAAPCKNTVITIQGERIAKVAEGTDNSYPQDATILDLAGCYVLPGFIDTHVHLAPDPTAQHQTLSTLLAFGITTVRNANAVPEAGIKLREKIATGEVLGPRMLTAGRFIDFPLEGRHNPGTAWVKTEKETRKEVKRQVKSGVDFIKLQGGLPSNLVRAAIDEAHVHGIKVIGHLRSTSWTQAATAGIDGLCHSGLNGPLRELVRRQQRDGFFDEQFKRTPEQIRRLREAINLNSPEFNNLIATLLKNRVEVNPTLIRTEVVWWGDDLDLLKKLEPEYTAGYWGWGRTWAARHPYSRKLSYESLNEFKAMFPTVLEMVCTFHKRGVLLTAGTDVGNPWITPGVSFHHELELLVKAGVSCLDVLCIATRNGAQALGILNEVGTIDEGKVADLVVLTENPLDDILNSRKIELVIKSGRRLQPRSLIDQQPKVEYSTASADQN